MDTLACIAAAVGAVMLLQSLFSGCVNDNCRGRKRLKETRKSQRAGVHEERLDVCAACGYGRIDMLDPKGDVLWTAHETVHVDRRR